MEAQIFVLILGCFLYMATRYSVTGYRYHSHRYYYYYRAYYYNQSRGNTSQGYIAGIAFGCMILGIVFLYLSFKFGCCKKMFRKPWRRSISPQNTTLRSSRNGNNNFNGAELQISTLSMNDQPPPYHSVPPAYLSAPPAYSYEPEEGATSNNTSLRLSAMSPPPPYSTNSQT